MLSITDRIKSSPRLKSWALWLLMPRNQARPRWWVRHLYNPFVHPRGSGSHVCASVRLDVLPSRKFVLGSDSTIEDFATINNGVGDVLIGNRTRIGLGCVLIGPVTVGNDVMLAQNIVVSGLNHSYQDISQPIATQACTTALISIADEVWIGANAVITAGVSIGKHSVVAAGSVVTRSVPPYTVVAGNPAKIIKQYNANQQTWQKP